MKNNASHNVYYWPFSVETGQEKNGTLFQPPNSNIWGRFEKQ